jgi:hypothetical protein
MLKLNNLAPQLTTNNVDSMRRTVDGLLFDMQNMKKEQTDTAIRLRRVQVRSTFAFPLIALLM